MERVPICIACIPLKLKRPHWIYCWQVIVRPRPTTTSPTQKPYYAVRQILVPHCLGQQLIRPPYGRRYDAIRSKFEFTDGVLRCSPGVPETNKRFARETTLTICRRLTISRNISERFTRITVLVICCRRQAINAGLQSLRPSSDAVLHMSRIEYKWEKSFVLPH